MAKQALNGRERRKPQRTHKMLVNSMILRVKCSYFVPFIVVIQNQILNGSSLNLYSCQTWEVSEIIYRS